RGTPRLSGPPLASDRGRGGERTDRPARDAVRTEPASRPCRLSRYVRSALHPMWLASLVGRSIRGLVAGRGGKVQWPTFRAENGQHRATLLPKTHPTPTKPAQTRLAAKLPPNAPEPQAIPCRRCVVHASGRSSTAPGG